MTVEVQAPRWVRPSALTPLVRATAANAAGDAFIAVALADTLFFGVATSTARAKVALYLLVTMAPFAIVAPVIGPLLDRFHRGRRIALALTFIGRAALAWAMLSGSGLRLYPAAFGCLVLSKCYGVARAAAVPRLIGEGGTLVGAGARLALTSILSGALGATFAAGLVTVGDDFRWGLRGAIVIFAGALLLALRLPGIIDGDPHGSGPRAQEHIRAPHFRRPVRNALVAALSLRALSGYLTMFLAFLFRGRNDKAGLAAVAVAAALGGISGAGLGARLRKTPPRLLLDLALVTAIVGCALAAWRFSTNTAAVLSSASALAGSLGKLALDATIQDEVGDAERGQAFARSETALQLAWVAGAGLGLVFPFRARVGMALAAAALAAAAYEIRRSRKG